MGDVSTVYNLIDNIRGNGVEGQRFLKICEEAGETDIPGQIERAIQESKSRIGRKGGRVN